MILNAALELLKKRGYDAVNINRLAKELGCSTQPVYLSFSGMEALISMAVEEFWKYMASESPDGRICLYDMSYIRFAKEQPRLFCFLFMRPNAFGEIRQALVPMIEASIGEPMEAYRIDHQEADLLHNQLWMHAHGIADTFVVSFSSEAAVSGVSLVTSFNTVLIFLFTALFSGGAVIISQYISSRNQEGASRAESREPPQMRQLPAFYLTQIF